MFIQMLAAVAASSFISLLGATLLALWKKWTPQLGVYLTAFSSGVLLTAALLHLAPEATEVLGSQTAFRGIFIAILTFFVLERFVLWYHHHHEGHDTVAPSAWLIVIGDTLHNFFDGVLIAGVFMVNPALGWAAALAVAAHEIPQEIADFGVMVSAGMKPKKAILLNIVSAAAALAGALIGWFFFSQLEGLASLATAFSAGMFLYIALSDLIPELHKHAHGSDEKWGQFVFLLLGIALFWGVLALLPHESVHVGHEDECHVEQCELDVDHAESDHDMIDQHDDSPVDPDEHKDNDTH